MVQPVPEEFAASAALQYIVSKGWSWEDAGGNNVKVETCPFCKKGEGKFYVGVLGAKDGLFKCFHGKCSKEGNLRTLQEHCGDRIAGVTSSRDFSGSKDSPEALPDVETCHSALLGDAEAMDYLVNVRGFSEDVIRRMRLGLKPDVFFREAGKRTALVYPYLVQGAIVFAKYRTLPPAPKDFTCPKGYEAGLYNADALHEGIQEIIFVEGEANTVAMLSLGIESVVGIPGANVRKATWIEQLDQIAPKRIYVMFDSYDSAGEKNAQELASRIGFDKFPLKLELPKFEVTVPQDECKLCNQDGMRTIDGKTVACDHKRLGKDFNEWIRKGGGTLEAFEELKKNAKPFDVTGVKSSSDSISLLIDQLKGKEELTPTYMSPWAALNRLVGFENGDVIDILAPEKVGKTTFGLNLLDHMCATYGEDGLLVCLEMTHERLARKHVAMLTEFDDIICSPGSPEAKAKLTELITKAESARETLRTRASTMYFAYPQLLNSPDDVYKLIKDCIRRYGVKWVMLDNVQLLCDKTLRNQGHRTVHLSQISKALAGIAKQDHIKLIRILQPHAIMEGDVPSARHVDGSSQIAKDCDAMLVAWREKIGATKIKQLTEIAMEEDGQFAPKMTIRVALTRYSGGGSCDLWFDGAKSKVYSYDPTKHSQNIVTQQNFNKVIGETGVSLAPPTENIALATVPQEVTL